MLRRATEFAPELACYLVIAAGTGARRSEIVALRWRDVDLYGGTVTIERGVVMGPDGLVEKDTKTHAARRVALDGQTVELIGEHRTRMHARAEVFGVVLGDDAFVFSNAADGSEPWFPDSVSRGFKRLCEREELHGVRLHDLRHFVASQLLSAGVDVRPSPVASDIGMQRRPSTSTPTSSSRQIAVPPRSSATSSHRRHAIRQQMRRRLEAATQGEPADRAARPR